MTDARERLEALCSEMERVAGIEFESELAQGMGQSAKVYGEELRAILDAMPEELGHTTGTDPIVEHFDSGWIDAGTMYIQSDPHGLSTWESVLCRAVAVPRSDDYYVKIKPVESHENG